MVKQLHTLSQRLLSFLGVGEPTTDSAAGTVVLSGAEAMGSFRLPESFEERYDVVRVLGRGAFGIVFLARDLRIGRMIAIKQLYRQFRGRHGIHTRFLQEARIAGQLEHPNIVTIYDVDSDAEAPCITMEYLAGGSLATILELEGALSERVALRYMRGILNGLGAAHRMRVVHRDIKPRNILFDQRSRPKIGDFGVAHLPEEAGGIMGSDDLGPAGTPAYMAPEQLHADRPIDARTDLFSAGVMLFEMLSGRRLYQFEDERDFASMAAVIERTPTPQVGELIAGISPAVESIVGRLLQREPEARYASAEAALVDVEAALAGLPAAAQAASPGLPTGDMFADILRLLLVDGVMSSPERRELSRRAERLGIGPAQAVEIEERIRGEMGLVSLQRLLEFEHEVESLLGDGDFSPGDRERLQRLAREHGISPEEKRKIEDRVQLKLHMKE